MDVWWGCMREMALGLPVVSINALFALHALIGCRTRQQVGVTSLQASDKEDPADEGTPTQSQAAADTVYRTRGKTSVRETLRLAPIDALVDLLLQTAFKDMSHPTNKAWPSDEFKDHVSASQSRLARMLSITDCLLEVHVSLYT